MPSNCAVSTCHSWEKGRRESGLAFFRFPKDKALRTAWLHRCGRKDEFNLDSTAVCSKHFLPTDYDPSYLVKRTLLPDTRPRLRSGAVPSQNLLTSISRYVVHGIGKTSVFFLVLMLECPNPALTEPGAKIHVRQCSHSNQRIRFYTYQIT